MEEYASKWMKRWEEARAFEAEPDPKRRKVFVTFPFPYMNGPLTAGHIFSACRIDTFARFKRMQGFNVLYPWAWHWTGQPVVAAAQRLKEGDPVQRRIFLEMDRVPEKELSKFVDPVYMATYYTAENRQVVKSMGLSIDWRREFHTSSYEPLFDRFVRWQYNRLRELGYVVKGTHPVVWCPKDKSPTQDHDRLEGEGVAPEEYTLIKFRLDGTDEYLVAGTLRAETIFGITNIWVKPDGKYVRIRVDGQVWVVSSETPGKLAEQLMKVEVLSEVKGSELLGRICIAPFTGRRVPVLPALFVDTGSVTGIVYSVPAHAPYDLLALRDLASGDKRLPSGFGQIAVGISPIPVIKLAGFEEIPAAQVVDKAGVKDQLDTKAEAATKDLYNREFHSGIMLANSRTYSGMPVSEAKAAVIQDLKAAGYALSFYDLPEPVICRCNTSCIVKVLEGQWFLTYGDEVWKSRSVEAIRRARILPEESRQQFIQTVHWLKAYPCARKTGLGTRLPWDEEWLVETLSDSTVYMAFYTIVTQLRRYQIKPEQLTDSALTYIFMGKGSLSSVAEESGMGPEILESLRNEFLYWYPVDLRNSGKDLVSNHLTFFIMQHVALFEESHWPRAVGVNGMVQLEGARMSKSHGNFVSAKDLINEYGADASRATLLASAEALDDPDWRSKNAADMRDKISSLPSFVQKTLSNSKEREGDMLDRWLFSQLQRRIIAVTEALEELRTRTAFYNAFFAPWNDVRWYLRRTTPNRSTLTRFFEEWIRLLSPFVPFVAEEVNERLGGKGLISLSNWPEIRKESIDIQAEAAEELVDGVVRDIKGILGVVKKPVTSALIVVADRRAREALKETVRLLSSGKKEGEVIGELVASQADTDRASYSKLVQAALRHCRETGIERISRIMEAQVDEAEVLTSASDFIAKETGLKSIKISYEEEAGEGKKGRTPLPAKPVIILT